MFLFRELTTSELLYILIDCRNLKIKEMMILLKVDLHVHTVNSGHGLNTWLEYVEEAKRKKIEILGFTEHGPNTAGARHDGYFDVQERMPDQYKGVKIFKGCELNISNSNTGIDLSLENLKRQTLLSVGFHSNSPKFSSQKERTEKLKNVLNKHPYIHIINHPYLVDLNMEDIAQYACKNNFLIELNTSTFKYKLTDKKLKDEILGRVKILIDVVKKLNGMFIVGSDAHIITDLGDDEIFKEYMEIFNLKDNDFINNFSGNLLKYIHKKNQLLQFI